MKTIIFLTIFFLNSLIIENELHACTTFSLPNTDHLVVGKSYDWHAGHGLVFLNHSNVSKQAVDLNNDFKTPAKWVSNYGSLSFTQFGIDLPLGGVNEEGLVVEIMWLGSSIYPTQKKLPELNELQWIQYILDQAKTTEEAISLAKKVQINQYFAAVHYMVCDLNQKCASFEYIDRKLVINRQSIPTLTNSTFKSSNNYLPNFDGFGGDREIPTSNGSLARLVRASSLASKIEQGSFNVFTAEAFDVLKSVQTRRILGDGLTTQWQIVYEPNLNKISYKTPLSIRTLTIDTDIFDYDCKDSNISILDLKGDVLTGVSRWKFLDYNLSHHRRIIKKGNASIGSPIPQSRMDYIEQALHSRECLSL